jgi:hypothetical protein
MQRVGNGWQSADLFALRAVAVGRKPLTLLGAGADRVLGGSGSEVRIIFAASPKCGLLNQSHTRSISC